MYVLTLVCLLFAATAYWLGEPSRDYLLGSASAALFGLVGTAGWLLGPWRRSVVETPHGLGVCRGRSPTRVVEWSKIETVRWGGGSRYPSIDDPASFPEIVIASSDPDDDLVMEEILVVGRRARRRAEKAIEECCRRHGVRCAGQADLSVAC